MAGALLLRDRLSVVRAVYPERAGRPDYQLSHECLDVESVAAGGHLADPKERHLEADILRISRPYLNRPPDTRGPS